MVGAVAGQACGFDEGDGLVAECAPRLFEFMGRDVPQACGVWIAVTAERLCALPPQAGQVAGYGVIIHTIQVHATALTEMTDRPETI